MNGKGLFHPSTPLTSHLCACTVQYLLAFHFLWILTWAHKSEICVNYLVKRNFLSLYCETIVSYMGVDVIKHDLDNQKQCYVMLVVYPIGLGIWYAWNVWRHTQIRLYHSS